MIIKFGALRGSFGHLIMNTFAFFSKKNSNNLTVISTLKRNISNKYVYNLLVENFSSNKVIFLESYIVNFFYRLIFKLSKFVKFFSSFIANVEWIHRENPKKKYGTIYNFDEKYYRSPKKIKIPYEYKQYFNHWRKKKNLTKKIVCLHARENYYYGEKSENPRNFNFRDFEYLIKKLIKKNYFVVRLGQKTKKIDLNIDKNFLDLWHVEKNNKKYQLLEMMLVQSSEFIVTSVGGFDAYAALFDKKIFQINHFPGGRLPSYNKCIFIPQLYLKNNKIINFREIPKEILLSENLSDLKKRNLKLKKNSKNEISDIVINNLNKMHGKNLKDKKYKVEGSGGLICKSFFNKYKKFF